MKLLKVMIATTLALMALHAVADAKPAACSQSQRLDGVLRELPAGHAAHAALKGLRSAVGSCEDVADAGGTKAEVRSSYRACVEKIERSQRAIEQSIGADVSDVTGQLRRDTGSIVGGLYDKFRDRL
jgi:hypothetical protein